jgi:DNA gyrase subunit A
MGVRGMRIDEGTRVVGMEVLEDQETLLTVTENGFGKRSSVEEYRTQIRGGKGVFSIKTSKRNGQMVSLALVGDHDELMMVTDKGKLIRTAIDGINVISRNTQGVKLINLSPKETLIGIARLPEGEAGPETDGEENGEADENQDPTDEMEENDKNDEIEENDDQGDKGE